MNQFELGEAADLGRSTIQKLEKGTASPEEETLRKMDRALKWQPGSIAAVAAGGEPTPIRDELPAETTTWQREPFTDDDLVSLVHSIVYEAVVVAAPETPLSRVKEIEELALESARRAGFGRRNRRLPTHTEDDPAA